MGRRAYYNRFDEEPIELDTEINRKLQELSLKILQQHKDKYDTKELEKQAVISEARVQAARDTVALSKYYDDKLETTHTELNDLKNKLTNLNNWVSVIDSKSDVADVATTGNKKKRRITVRVRI
jgi:hypothetical protein